MIQNKKEDHSVYVLTLPFKILYNTGQVSLPVSTTAINAEQNAVGNRGPVRLWLSAFKARVIARQGQNRLLFRCVHREIEQKVLREILYLCSRPGQSMPHYARNIYSRSVAVAAVTVNRLQGIGTYVLLYRYLATVE